MSARFRHVLARIVPTDHQILYLSDRVTYPSVSVPLAAAEQATTPCSRTRAHIMETDMGLPPPPPVVQKPPALTHHRYPPRALPPAPGLSPPPALSQAPAPDTVPVPGPGRGPRVSAATLRWARRARQKEIKRQHMGPVNKKQDSQATTLSTVALTQDKNVCYKRLNCNS